MALWLYQMSAKKKLSKSGYKWTPAKHRKQVWEGYYLEWETRQIRSIKPGVTPQAGDTIVYWFVKSGTENPGLYGWGIVFEQNEGTICHLPVFPSDHLKMRPVYNDKIAKIVKEIQSKMPIATLFQLTRGQAEELWSIIRDWIIQYSKKRR
jgi:hypothetical protein